jgi:DNA-directed RNA polymerase subunit RPC12/RpoP
MARCPRCGSEIDHLLVRYLSWEEYELRVDKRGEPVYEPIDSWDAGQPSIYLCPNCMEKLFTDDEEAAIEFLKQT